MEGSVVLTDTHPKGGKELGYHQKEVPEMSSDQANTGQSSGSLHREHYALQCIGSPVQAERDQKDANFHGQEI